MLAAAGGTLHRLSLSLQDISRIVQLAVGKNAQADEGVRPGTEVLRGTVYDRNYKELAVSYQLYSLFVHPVELIDRHRVAKELSRIVGIDRETLDDHLKNSEGIIEVADDLDEQQAAAIESLSLQGVVCKPIEERYYPAHTIAAHLLGFTGKGTGLSGVEAMYDRVLQPGEFRNNDVPEVDLTEEESLGRTTADVVLTVNLDLQKAVEQQLSAYRKQQGAAYGNALVLDAGNGQVLAMASQPGFDPNYFWQADTKRLKNTVFTKRFAPELVRPLFLRAAAIIQAGIGNTLLPDTVRSVNYGMSNKTLNEYFSRFAVEHPVKNLISSGSEEFEDPKQTPFSEMLSPVQIAVGVASLVNGGKRVLPHVLRGLYDQTQARFYMRAKGIDQQERVIGPADGVFLRRALLLDSPFSGKKGLLFSNKVALPYTTNSGLTDHKIQEILVVAVPQKIPKVLLVMQVGYDTLFPLQKNKKTRNRKDPVRAVGKKLIAALNSHGANGNVAEHPATKTEGNYRRYLISRRLDMPEQKKAFGVVERVMPDLKGLSMRKGLQHLSSLEVEVSIEGSGRIVAQHPDAGASLGSDIRCELTLESRI